MATRKTDLCIATGVASDEPFVLLLREACALRRLSCVVCNDRNIKRVLAAAEDGRLRIGTHVDLFGHLADTNNPYTRLSYAAKDGGAFTINEPKNATMAENKAVMHYEFERAGIPVPFTVVVRNWKPARFALTRRQRARLGRPFIVKPARGYGKQGVVKVTHGSLKAITRARRFDRGDDFLLQEFVEPVWFGPRMGWLRVHYVLGEVMLSWWDTLTQHYTPVTLGEFRAHGLAGLVVIARKIAQTSGMCYFSTEVAIVRRHGRTLFLVVDYVNDPCDMTLQTRSHSGVPDSVVEHVADRIAEAALHVARNGDAYDDIGVWFAG
ncbi:MAG: hypothetical protein JXR37_20660 [Kiritimatiellae bacterium]|nr:hypothetical protein [Kiritimatiellia bacterium]